MATPVAAALTICGANADHIAALETRKALDSLEDYADMTTSDMNVLATKIEKRTAAQGKVIIPTKILKNLHALCFWASERVRKNEALDHNLFTVNALRDAKSEMKLRKDTSDQTSSIKPDKFTPAKWRDFERLFPMYLSGFKGAQHASLEYILRPAIPPDHVHLEQRVQELYDYPLTGRHFTEDNHATYRLLADLLAGTEGMSWIEAFQSSQNGRAAWIALKSHYDGGGQKEKRVAQAEALIASLFYKNESVFPFEKFSTGLLDAYRELFLAERPVPEYNKVKRMLEKVVITHGRIEVVKHQVRQDFRADFQGALDFLSTQFAEMFPDATFEQPGRRRRFVATADSEWQSLSQRPRLDELVTHENGAAIIHGVDVTEVGRTFSGGEMSTLGPMGQAYIFQERERLGLSRGNNRGGRGRGGGGRG